jgi:hypothetical protein
MQNQDELLFYNLNKIKLSLSNILNIYFTYKKIKKGCYIDINKKLSNNFINILIQYKLKYKKYVNVFNDKNSDYYFISKKINPININFIENNCLNDIELGKFLGYGCIHNLKRDKPCEKGYLLNIQYINYNLFEHINVYVYGFCCQKIDNNIINNTLQIIHKMNYCIKKYLSKILEGYIQLTILKLNDLK